MQCLIVSAGVGVWDQRPVADSFGTGGGGGGGGGDGDGGDVVVF